MEIVDNTPFIINLIEPINLFIELQVERKHGYRMKTPNNIEDLHLPHICT